MEKQPAGLDKELQAMGTIGRLLDALDEAQRVSILRWISDRYRGKAGAVDASETVGGAGSRFSALPEFFAAARPSTEAERVLVAGYWFQYVQEEANLDAFRINTELKNMGVAVSNVTRAFDVLKAESPAQVIQIAKSGKAQQARKKYRLTTAGKSKVDAMLAG